MSTVGKPFVVAAIARDAGVTLNVADAAFDAFIEAVKTGTTDAGDKVVLKGFATFERVAKPARMATNPATGEKVQVPAREAIRVKAKY